MRPPEKISNGFIVTMSRNGHNNEEIQNLWLEKCWGRQRNSLACMLVGDSLKSYVMASIQERVKKHYNSHMAVIPGGCN